MSLPLGPFLAGIGGAPLVPLRRVAAAERWLGVALWAKLEGAKPGGPVRERAALNMVVGAEGSGRLRPGVTILDASSRGAILRARAAADPSLVYLDQYSNLANWGAPARSTGPEVWAALGPRLTHFVAGLGTTGTFMGLSRAPGQAHPRVRCNSVQLGAARCSSVQLGAARCSSVQLGAARCSSVQPDGPLHCLEGLPRTAASNAPPINDAGLADEALSAPTDERLRLQHRLGRSAVILVGPSAAAALWGAIDLGRRLYSGVIGTIFPEGAGRYLSDAQLFQPVGCGAARHRRGHPLGAPIRCRRLAEGRSEMLEERLDFGPPAHQTRSSGRAYAPVVPIKQ